MLREKRHALILEALKQEKVITIQDLSQRLGASYMTIWRDLETLEAEGLLQRVRGGAMSDSTAVVSPAQAFALPEPKPDLAYPRKQKIGQYAARELVEAGDAIIVEAGTTASSMVPYLSQPGLTVLTNGLFTSALAYPAVKSLTLMCSGGILIETGAFAGPQAEEFFSKFRVKKAFLGAQGVTLEDGFTDPTSLYMNLKSVMKRMAETVVMMLDSSKFGVRSLMQVVALDEAGIVVTDDAAPPEIVEGLRRRGIDVRIAE